MQSTKKPRIKRSKPGISLYPQVIAFRIPQDIHKALKDEAERDARTMADVAREKLIGCIRRKRA